VNAIRSPANGVFFSVVSLWEALIRFQLGKRPLPEPPELYLPRERQRHRIASLDVDEGSVTALASLSAVHRDPFDRLLVAQAVRHGMTVVTVDQSVRADPVSCLPIVSP
jgi:PIN domain nuclease of toxin-antitoxin system